MTNHLEKTWYKDWFNSPFYTCLYQHRDAKEATQFIDNLNRYLQPAENAKMLDLACGSGRHAIALRSKGYEVVGVDLSETHINKALKYADAQLNFFVHDMRKVFRSEYFDYVFNLFTSFGYFAERKENLEVLKAVHQSLKSGGKFIFDFMNVNAVLKKMKPEERFEVDDTVFLTKKYVEKDTLIKEILVCHDDREYTFLEKVKVLTLDDLLALFEEANLKVLQTFGDHDLNAFDSVSSPQVILIAEKDNS